MNNIILKSFIELNKINISEDFFNINRQSNILKEINSDLLEIADNYQYEDFIELLNRLSLELTDDIYRQLSELNQYIQFTDTMKISIFQIYLLFLKNIFEFVNIYERFEDSFLSTSLYELKNSILSNLKQLEEFNNIYVSHTKENIPCFEYSADFQLEVLNLYTDELMEPILDLGCGEEANLVEYFREYGLFAFGINRKIINKKDYLMERDWFNFLLKPNSFGTIISHLAFSNHFRREHLKKGEGHIAYAKRYVEILESLKIGGQFIYAPSLTFIEEALDPNEYRVERFILDKKYNSSTITRLI